MTAPATTNKITPLTAVSTQKLLTAVNYDEAVRSTQTSAAENKAAGNAADLHVVADTSATEKAAAAVKTEAVTTMTLSQFLCRRAGLAADSADTSTRPGCPTPNKTAYADTETAERHLSHILSTGRSGMSLPHRHYACPCGYWHLTSQSYEEIDPRFLIEIIDQKKKGNSQHSAARADVIDFEIYANSVTRLARNRERERAKAWRRRASGSRRGLQAQRRLRAGGRGAEVFV